MLKQPITFTDFNGVKRTEEHYFNLTKAELFKMEVTAEGNSLVDHLKTVVESNSGKSIVETFESILKSSYGVRSDDGTRFMKSDKLWEEFTQTEAYSEFFFSLVTDAEKAAAFIRGVVPVDIDSNKSLDDLRKETLAQKGGYNKPSEPEAKVVAEVPTEYVDTKDRAPLNEQEIGQLTREQLEARLNEMGQSDLK